MKPGDVERTSSRRRVPTDEWNQFTIFNEFIGAIIIKRSQVLLSVYRFMAVIVLLFRASVDFTIKFIVINFISGLTDHRLSRTQPERLLRSAKLVVSCNREMIQTLGP